MSLLQFSVSSLSFGISLISIIFPIVFPILRPIGIGCALAFGFLFDLFDAEYFKLNAIIKCVVSFLFLIQINPKFVKLPQRFKYTQISQQEIVSSKIGKTDPNLRIKFLILLCFACQLFANGFNFYFLSKIPTSIVFLEFVSDQIKSLIIFGLILGSSSLMITSSRINISLLLFYSISFSVGIFLTFFLQQFGWLQNSSLIYSIVLLNLRYFDPSQSNNDSEFSYNNLNNEDQPKFRPLYNNMNPQQQQEQVDRFYSSLSSSSSSSSSSSFLPTPQSQDSNVLMELLKIFFSPSPRQPHFYSSPSSPSSSSSSLSSFIFSFSENMLSVLLASCCLYLAYSHLSPYLILPDSFLSSHSNPSSSSSSSSSSLSFNPSSSSISSFSSLDSSLEQEFQQRKYKQQKQKQQKQQHLHQQLTNGWISIIIPSNQKQHSSSSSYPTISSSSHHHHQQQQQQVNGIRDNRRKGDMEMIEISLQNDHEEEGEGESEKEKDDEEEGDAFCDDENEDEGEVDEEDNEEEDDDYDYDNDDNDDDDDEEEEPEGDEEQQLIINTLNEYRNKRNRKLSSSSFSSSSSSLMEKILRRQKREMDLRWVGLGMMIGIVYFL